MYTMQETMTCPEALLRGCCDDYCRKPCHVYAAFACLGWGTIIVGSRVLHSRLRRLLHERLLLPQTVSPSLPAT